MALLDFPNVIGPNASNADSETNFAEVWTLKKSYRRLCPQKVLQAQWLHVTDTEIVIPWFGHPNFALTVCVFPPKLRQNPEVLSVFFSSRPCIAYSANSW